MAKFTSLDSFVLVSAVAMTAALHAACGDESSRPGTDASDATTDSTPDTTADTSDPRCIPDPTLIASARACLDDDHCPCGSHCALGACVATCSAALPCPDDLSCDTFGRCRDVDTTLRPAAPNEAAGDLVLDATAVPVDGLGRLDLRAASDVGPVRVVVTGPFEIRCDPAASFTSECVVPLVRAGTETTLAVRALGPSTSTPTSGLARVHWGPHLDTRSLTTTPSPLRADQLPLAALRATYRGTATRLGASLSDPPTTPLAVLAVPVSAQLYDTSETTAVLELFDRYHALSDHGDTASWPLAMTWTAATRTGTLTASRRAFWDGELADTATQIQWSATPADVRVDDAGRVLTFELDATYLGLGTPADLGARWLVVLARETNLAASATPPALPAQPAPPAPSTGTTRWERLFQGLMVDWSAVTEPTDLSELVRTATESGASRRMDACGPNNRLTLGQEVPVPVRGTRDLLIAKPFEAQAQDYVKRAIEVASANYAADTSDLTLGPITTLDADVLPCRVELTGSTFKDCDGNGLSLSTTLDLCTLFEREYGCRVEDTPADATLEGQVGLFGDLDLTLTPAFGNPLVCEIPNSIELIGRTTRVCVVPPIVTCGELALCATSATSSTAFDTSAVDPKSLDLKCDGSNRSVAIAAERLSPAPRRGDLAADCLADLERLDDTIAPPYDLSVLFDETARCLDAARHLVALGLATDVVRAPSETASSDARSRASRLAGRLLSQWLEVHELVALEARERVLPAEISGSVAGGFDTSAEVALGRSLAGWNLLLHPRYAPALAMAEPAALAEPDYRTSFIPALAISTGAPQQDGLAVQILRTLKAQLELTERLLEARPSQASALARIGRVLRVATLADALADDLHRRALSIQGNTPLPWEDAWIRAKGAYQAALEAVVARAANLLAGRDVDLPSEADLPLYFDAGSTPSSRFTAISDYLLGADANTQGFAEQIVAQARSAFGEAVTAFQSSVEQDYRAQIDLEAREDAIRETYGEPVVSFCGLPSGLSSNAVLDGWEAARAAPFDANTCYFKLEEPACRAGFEIANSLLNRDDILLALCAVHEVTRLAPGQVFFRDPALSEASRTFAPETCGELSDCGEKRCLTCGPLTLEVSAPALTAIMGLTATTTPLYQRAQTTCRERFPLAHSRVPMPRDVGVDAGAEPGCLRGAGGELALAIQGARLEVETARSLLTEHMERYRIAMTSCLELQRTAQDVAVAEGIFNTAMTVLEAAKVAAQGAANYCDAVADCTYALSGVDGLASAGTLGATAISAAVGCGFDLAGVGFQAVADTLESTISQGERLHQATLRALDDRAAVAMCFNDASEKLVGIRTAELQIRRALQDVDAAAYKLRDASQAVAWSHREGLDALRELERRGSSAPRHELWLDRRIDTFLGTMKRARRVTYLAARAVEYELQASLPERAEIAFARVPDELAGIVARLKTAAAPGSIFGNQPTDLKAIISLREQVLQLEDRSNIPASEQRLSAIERLRLLLTSPANAVFAKDGTYLGQELRFSLAPLGALGLGEAGGVSLYAATDCAERVWSVNASILGGDDATSPPYRGAEPPSFVRVDLLKQNTFYSQWCGEAPEGAGAFQAASVRPAVNLFRDPLVGGNVATGVGAALGNDGFTRARIEAHLGVSRSELSQDAFASGATAELAARGLYGAYAVFIPKELIARRNADGTYTPGLDLERIDDILLRIDYVSVARPTR